MRLPLSLLLLGLAVGHAAPNLVGNGSFEFATGSMPTGWTWSGGKAAAKMEWRSDGGADGNSYVRISNPSAQKPNVFGQLKTYVSVEPDTEYTVSAYIRGAAPGMGFLGGGAGWKVRFALPAGHDDWTRFGGTFRTGEKETRLELMVLTESTTEGFDIDAIQLEKGNKRTAYETGVVPGSLKLAVVPAADAKFGVNLVPNPSFEQVDGVRPKHWVWDSRNTDSTFSVTDDARSGDAAIRITNKTPASPHVYGQLVLMGGLQLTPGETYTLSAYVKSEEPGRAWIGGGSGWWMRIGLRDTHNQWRRVTRTFTARNEDTSFPLMINTDSPTPGFLVDDIKLEQGLAATEFDDGQFAKAPVHVQLSLADTISCDGLTTEFSGIVNIKEAAGPQSVSLTIRSTDGSYAAQADVPGTLPPGTHYMQITWSLPNNAPAKYEASLLVGETPASQTFELFTPARFKAEAARATEALAGIDAALADADRAGIVCPYAKAARVIARHFLPIAETKVQKGVTAEGVRDATFLADLCAEQTRNVRAALAKTYTPPAIPDPDLSKTIIRDGNFYVGNDPVMLVGGMGYGELKQALPHYSDYGFNIVGDDYDNGLSCFARLREDETLDLDTLPKLRESWESLAKQNLAVAFNPTLHYFPSWALQKFTDITGGDPVDALPDWSGLNRNRDKRTKRYGAFFPFAIDSPSLRRLVSLYYGQLFPGLRDVPGFQVIWLMNEPTYTHTKDPHYLQLFHESLTAKYGDLAGINKAWGSEYKDLSEIREQTVPGSLPRFDWLTFHQDQVASWFEWLGAEARRSNPDLPLSNKPMAWTLLRPGTGIDFEREAELWDIPGCDAGRSPKSDDYAFNWQTSVMLFDFQKSVAPDKPLGDHEYHYIHEADVSPEYVRATYFHSYLRGLRMSQFWVWATGHIGEGKTGAGMLHTAWQQPRVAWGTATSALDLRRLARYIAPFPGTPEVAIYYSKPSLCLDGDYSSTLSQTHAATNFLDAPVGFVTDRMILAGKLSPYRLLIVPAATYVEPDVRQAIADFARNGGRLLLIGDSLSLSPAGAPYGDAVTGPGLQKIEDPDPALLADAFDKAGISRPVRVSSSAPHHVECRSVTVDGKTVIYLLALGKETETIRVAANGKPLGTWTDLVARSQGQGGEFTLAPQEIRLLQLD